MTESGKMMATPARSRKFLTVLWQIIQMLMLRDQRLEIAKQYYRSIGYQCSRFASRSFGKGLRHHSSSVAW